MHDSDIARKVASSLVSSRMRSFDTGEAQLDVFVEFQFEVPYILKPITCRYPFITFDPCSMIRLVMKQGICAVNHGI